jgi:hypothetical protein
MANHSNEVEAVPEPDPVVTIVVGDGSVPPVNLLRMDLTYARA